MADSVVGSEGVGTVDAGAPGSELVAATEGWAGREGAAGLGRDEQPVTSAAHASVTQARRTSRCCRPNGFRMTEA